MSDEVRLVAGLALALLATLALTPLAIGLARRTGFHDVPHTYKAHASPTPYLGGLAVIAGFLASMIAFGAGDMSRLAPMAGCALALLVVGTIDDRRSLRPLSRVLAAIAAANVVWLAGLGWSLFDSDALNLALTNLWVLAVVNAFNLMDNMDGAAGSVGSVSAAGILALAVATDDLFLAGLAAALCGALLGFLPMNLSSPARIFLGDGGSMPAGFLLAVLVMGLPAPDQAGWTALPVGVLLVGLPILDTTLVVLSRARRGVSLMAGGRDHLTHRLRTLVPSARGVALALGAVQAALCMLAVVLAHSEPSAVVAASAACLSAGVVAILMLETPALAPARRDSWHPRATA